MKTKIYERFYDVPNNENGTPKPNNLLGEFEILETLFEDAYVSQKIASKDNKIFLIVESELTGIFGGSYTTIHELKSVIQHKTIQSVGDNLPKELQERIHKFNLWYALSNKMYAYKANAAFGVIYCAKQLNLLDSVPPEIFEFYDHDLEKVYNILDDFKESSEIIESILSNFARSSDDKRLLTEQLEQLLLTVKHNLDATKINS